MGRGFGAKGMAGLGALTGQDVRARRDLRDMRFLWTSIAAAVVFSLAVFLYLWCRLTVVTLGYEISKANAARNNIIEQNRRLKIEHAGLKNPERIERIAVKELDLVRPDGGQIIEIR